MKRVDAPYRLAHGCLALFAWLYYAEVINFVIPWLPVSVIGTEIDPLEMLGETKLPPVISSNDGVLMRPR